MDDPHYTLAGSGLQVVMLRGYRGSSRLPFANSVAELHLILPKQAVFANNSASDT
jgi:hypothetical protein